MSRSIRGPCDWCDGLSCSGCSTHLKICTCNLISIDIYFTDFHFTFCIGICHGKLLDFLTFYSDLSVRIHGKCDVICFYVFAVIRCCCFFQSIGSWLDRRCMCLLACIPLINYLTICINNSKMCSWKLFSTDIYFADLDVMVIVFIRHDNLVAINGLVVYKNLALITYCEVNILCNNILIAIWCCFLMKRIASWFQRNLTCLFSIRGPASIYLCTCSCLTGNGKLCTFDLNAVNILFTYINTSICIIIYHGNLINRLIINGNIAVRIYGKRDARSLYIFVARCSCLLKDIATWLQRNCMSFYITLFIFSINSGLPCNGINGITL